jgi:predicted ribosome quality control (RQC) complex YloA/Tae2 family protein
LPNCPKCGNKESLPSRTFSVIVEPSKGERGMTERRVGMYTCSSCGTKFPTVISRQQYLIVADDQLKAIQSELSTLKKGNEELQSKVQAMSVQQRELEGSMERAAKENEVKRLQAKLENLEAFVEYLRKEKGELEQKASRLR